MVPVYVKRSMAHHFVFLCVCFLCRSCGKLHACVLVAAGGVGQHTPLWVTRPRTRPCVCAFFRFFIGIRGSEVRCFVAYVSCRFTSLCASQRVRGSSVSVGVLVCILNAGRDGESLACDTAVVVDNINQ